MFGVYVHFPFCRKHCPYCDFAVWIRKEIPHKQYQDAILQEIQKKRILFPERSLTSIYFGGGTPSLWQSDCIETVLSAIHSTFPSQLSSEKIEITMECDPLDLLDLSQESLKKLQKIGINRLSIGIQSFQEQHLQALGRLHTEKQAKTSVLQAQEAGFNNISLDLIIGIPEQTEEEVVADIEEAMNLGPTHISIYQLTVEPKTPLASLVQRKKVKMPSLEKQASFYQKAQTVLHQFGFEQYEISSYARKEENKDYYSSHNSLYWTLQEYIGLGVSAHSFRYLPDGSGERFANTRNLHSYLANMATEQKTKSPIEKRGKSFLVLHSQEQEYDLYEHRSQEALAREALWLGLRQMKGISRQKFLEQFGADPLKLYPKEFEILQKRDWIEITSEWIRFTKDGILFADEAGSYLV